MVELCLAVGRIEIAGGNEEQVFPVAAESRRSGIEPLIGYGSRFPALHAVEINPIDALFLGLGVGNPFRVRRPGKIANLERGCLGDFVRFFGSHVDIAQT